MLSCKEGVGKRFQSNRLPLVRSFDHFSGLANEILAQSDFVDHPQMPFGGAVEQEGVLFNCHTLRYKD